MNDDLPPGCLIRAMTVQDITQSIGLWMESPGVGLGVGDDRSGIERFLLRNPGISQVALERQEIIGTCLGGHDGRRGMLYHVAICERWRRRGVGRSLVKATLALLAEQRIGKVGLLVKCENGSARDFWAENGFLLRSDVVYMQTRIAEIRDP